MYSGTDAEAETPILWPPHAKSWLIGKDPDAGRDWGQEEKGTTEDEMAGSYHRLDGHEFVWTPGVGDGQGGLECCDSWGLKELDTTEQLNWTELRLTLFIFRKNYVNTQVKIIITLYQLFFQVNIEFQGNFAFQLTNQVFFFKLAVIFE